MRPKHRNNQHKLSSGFNNKDIQHLTEINTTIKQLLKKVEYLKKVEKGKPKYDEIKTKNKKLKQIFNTIFFKTDELEQYVR